MKQKIIPNLWFDHNAKEAVEFYITAFPNSHITNIAYYPKSAEEGLADFQLEFAGKELTIDFTIGDLQLSAINAGSEFQPTPATSFMVHFSSAHDPQARKQLDALWDRLSSGGEVLMPLDAYPFSQHYGWVKDRYGHSWQLMLADTADEARPFIVPSLLFAGDQTNRAEEAIRFYLSVFDNAQTGALSRYPEATGPAKAGALQYADFTLAGQWFAAMDSGVAHDFAFTEAVSFVVLCKDQAEIDYFWKKLSKVPAAEQCGWCKDDFGVSWQIVPANMEALMQKPGAYEKLLAMKKLVIANF